MLIRCVGWHLRHPLISVYFLDDIVCLCRQEETTSAGVVAIPVLEELGKHAEDLVGGVLVVGVVVGSSGGLAGRGGARGG